MAILRKNWQKDASGNAVRALCRITGAGISAYALEKLTTSDGTNASTTIKNISGPAVMLAGVLGDLMFDDDKLRSFCQGLYTFAALKSVAVIAPSVGAPMGLSGLGLPEAGIVNGPEGIVNGIESSTETTTDDVPVEIAEISEGASNDGNDWAAVADYESEDADDAISVSEDSTTSGVEAAAMSMN